jgi:hypothetical protein
MTLAPFAALEQRLNAAVVHRLANAQAVYQGGQPFGVMFDRAPADPFNGAADVAGLTAGFCAANTPGLAQGSELVIDGVAHTVAGSVQPDAGGWVSVSVYPST